MAFRARVAWVAVGATLVASCAISVGAVSFDHRVVSTVRATYLPPDARWVDHAHVGAATLIQTPATPHARAHEQLFWNNSLKRVAFLDQASRIDAFDSPRVRVADDGRLMSRGQALRGPLVISNFAVRARLANAVAVARGADYELWRPLGTPRMALFVGGLYHDGWLAPAGNLTLWARRDGRVTATVRPRGPRAGHARAAALAPGRNAADDAASPRPRPRTARQRRPRPEPRRHDPGLAQWAVDAEVPLEPHRLSAARRPADQRAGRNAGLQRALLRHLAADDDDLGRLQ